MRISALLIVLLVSFTTSDAFAQNRFWLTNNSPKAIEHAYVSSAREQSWGGDVLGGAGLAVGGRVRIEPGFDACELDIRIVYTDGQSEERRNLNACTVNVIAFGDNAGRSAGGDPSFAFINGGDQVIRALYVSSSTLSNWGDNRLGDNTLRPGQRFQVLVAGGGGCQVDIRVVPASGPPREMRNVETCNRRSLRWR